MKRARSNPAGARNPPLQTAGDAPRMEWQDAIEWIRPYVFKISTPFGFGTGFLLWRSDNKGVCGIATAAHVIDHARVWEEPIRLEHQASSKTIMLREADRVIFSEDAPDAAVILCGSSHFQLPDRSITLIRENRYLRIGAEVGWVGYPAISEQQLCFFSGRTSSWLADSEMYLVDGVAINGVSGGPTFHIRGGVPRVIGVVSAYIANRATGETLPGLCVIRDVSALHDFIRRFKSFNEAKKEEPPPSPPPPASSSSQG